MGHQQKSVLSMIYLFLFALSVVAQEPTPFSPIVPQGNPNVGRPEPFAVSEVAVRTGLGAWQQAGWDGSGVRVGVIDRGFGGLSDTANALDLSINIAPGGDLASYSNHPIAHGTQVTDVIAQVAPGAELYACEYDDLTSFDLCITWMIRADVDIINHSAGVPALPIDGTNAWARQVDRVAREDILWVNSAGNYAEGYFSDRLTDSDLDRLHEFRAVGPQNNEALGVQTIQQASDGVVMLSWSDDAGRPANEIDLDLQVIDAQTGEIIVGSYGQQGGFPSDQAIEYVAFDMSRPFAVQVIDNAGDATGVEFALFVSFAQLPTQRAQGSVIAPADSPASLTVGALQGIMLAPYSSRGALENGQIGVDLVAPGEVILSSGQPFIGTSAAAPIVAASAALVMQANPNFSAADVRTYLENAAIDDADFPGRDNNYGFGRLDMPLLSAVATSPPPTPTPTLTPEPTATPSPTPTQQPTRTARPTRTPAPSDTPEPDNPEQIDDCTRTEAPARGSVPSFCPPKSPITPSVSDNSDDEDKVPNPPDPALFATAYAETGEMPDPLDFIDDSQAATMEFWQNGGGLSLGG